MRVRHSVLFVALAGVAVACLPNPAKDFEDYDERANELTPASDGGGGSFDAGAPPTEEVTGTFYGACLSQLAYFQLSRVFNFYVETKFVPAEAGGQLSLELMPLKLSPAQGPPEAVSKAGVTGETKHFQASAPNVGADGRYTIDLGTTTIPGDANPITGRDVVIADAKLTGIFGKDRFCARLNGNVTQPIQLTLDPPQNVCQFVPIEDGDKTPTFEQTDFDPGACPF